MMQRKVLCILIAFSVILGSCSDWLDVKPYDGVVEDDYWQTKEDVHAAVIGCYSSLLNMTLVSSIILWGELRADNITIGSSASGAQANIVRGEISTDNSIVKWDVFYSTINQCNKVIEKSELVRERDLTFTDALYRQYKAEATAIRSLMYFYLVRSFKDVPLTFKATDSDDQDFYLPKTDGDVILDSLVRQMANSMSHLPTDYGSNASNKGRMTRWAGMSLLADIYLWQGNYSGCVDLCNQVMGSGQFTLIPVSREQKEIMDDNNQGTGDYYYVANSTDADNLYNQLYITGNSVESIFEFQFPKSTETLGDPFYDLFNSGTSPNRPKLNANENVLGFVTFPEYEGEDNDVVDIRANNFSYKNNGDVWKWVGTGRSGATRRTVRQFPNWILYRLPDIMLMKAEALNQIAIKNASDQTMLQEAYELVKQIRERANAIEYSNSAFGENIDGKVLEKLILEERAREFTFEGKRWYDVLRFAKRDNYAGTNRDYLKELAVNSTEPDKVAGLQVKYNNNWFHYWPIHSGAVDINPNLVQNEYYAQN